MTVFIALAACSDDDSPVVPTEPPGQNGPLEILPLHETNWWGFRYSLIMSGDTAYQDYMDSIRVLRRETIDGEGWYGLYDINGMTDGFLYRNTDSGLVQFDRGTLRIALKYPGMVGDKQHSGFFATGSICTIMATDTVISVPAGNFHCYYYLVEDSAGNTIIQSFYSPGVGEVKFLSHRHFDSIELAELAGFHVE